MASPYTICLYLERLCGKRQAVAFDTDSMLHVMQLHALGQGLTDVLLQWSRERARPEPKRTDGYAAVLEAKVFSAIDALDQMPVSLDAAPFGLGHAAITSALGYLDFRFQEWIGAQAILVCATGSLDIWRDLHAPARSPPEITPLSSTEQTGMQTRHCAD